MNHDVRKIKVYNSMKLYNLLLLLHLQQIRGEWTAWPAESRCRCISNRLSSTHL